MATNLTESVQALLKDEYANQMQELVAISDKLSLIDSFIKDKQLSYKKGVRSYHEKGRGIYLYTGFLSQKMRYELAILLDKELHKSIEGEYYLELSPWCILWLG